MSSWIARVMGGKGPGTSRTRSALIRRYDAYLQVVRANADVLELLSEMETVATAGGTTGRQRFKAMVTRLGVQVYSMAKMLQVLGGSRYDALFPAIDRVRAGLETVLEEQPRPRHKTPWVVPIAALGTTAAEVVGGKAANLGSLVGAAGVSIPEGFSVTVDAFRAFLWHNQLEETVRVLSDALDPDEPVHLAETAERLRHEVLRGSLPEDLGRSLSSAADALISGLPGPALLAVRSSATGEDSELSFAGQYSSILDVPPGDVTVAYLQVLASFFNPRAVLMRLRRGFGALELGMGALVMPMLDGCVSGVAYSRDPLGHSDDVVLVEAVPGRGETLVSGTATPMSWSVRRSSSTVTATTPNNPGRALLRDDQVVAVARLAIRAEEALGCAADIEWTIDRDHRLWLLQARPLNTVTMAPATTADAVPGHRVLLEGGRCASPGVGIGHVIRVRGRDDALLLPQGSVMVAVEAVPDLALALPRAVAVVAERGAVTGHLAATAREFGVPALLGAPGATTKLVDGTLVTVDAGACRIYEGPVDELTRSVAAQPQPRKGRLAPLVEQVLPLVLPLNLRDPASDQFTPEHCRTVHDVVRFIHEKALMETVGIADGASGQGGAWYRVAEPLPFELRLVPLEGGVEPSPGAKTVKREQVSSLPAAALLEGLLDPEVQRKGPPPIDAAGFLSVISQSAFETDLGGPTWGMVSDRYLQLSSRIGYHFTTLEALIGDREQESRVSFVFRGGAADEPRRAHRARFIGRVLEGLAFQVTIKGDYVSGSFGHAPERSLLEVVANLGRLLVCANRLDMLLGEATLADWYAERFLAGDYAPVLNGERPPAESAPR